MQELSISVQQRIKKTKQVIINPMDSDIIRNLRQQQKIRCQKQSFILSMMRSNKLITSNLKKIYIKHSYQLMKLLEPCFEIKLNTNSDQDFLNEFVHLYTEFFKNFQNKFTFKTKIKNILRPTNHNLIMDLIKYFVDFTRDYYVQTIFWKMRNYSKTETSQLEQQIILFQQINQDNIPNKVKPFGSIHRNYSQITESPDNSFSPRKKTEESKKCQQLQEKKSNQNNYDILDVNFSPYAITITKQNPSNIQSLKMKINQFFRDQKSRNSSIKQIYQDYYDKYHSKYNKVQSLSMPVPYLSRYQRTDIINYKSLPYKMLLSVQKNGFSAIIIEIENKRPKNSYLSTTKTQNTTSLNSSPITSPMKINQNGFSSLKINQRIIQSEESMKNDYFLTSMKVLRVSQNFLPPLITSNNLGLYKNEKDGKYQFHKQKRSLLPFSIKLKKMTQDMQQAIPFMNQLSNSNNVLVRSTSFKHETIQKDNKRFDNHNNNKQLYSNEHIYSRQSNQKRVSRKQTQDSSLAYKLSSKKINMKKKILSQTRKSYQQTKYGYGSNNRKEHNKQSQQKILEWLQKIKNLKELQRKKIFGMNY